MVKREQINRMARPWQRDPLIERRHKAAAPKDLWAELTLAQKFSASSLLKQGYELVFIRHSSVGNIAIMCLESKFIAIEEDGAIDSTPSVQVR